MFPDPKHPTLILGKSPRRSSRRGMALVITLALLVLIAGLAMAFFSRAQLDRSIRAASASRDQATLLARSALDLITADLLQEIAAGSLPATNPANGVPLFQPRTTNSTTTLLGSSIRLVLTPSMAPQNTVNSTTHPTLVKESRHGQPGFVFRDGYVARTGVGNATLRTSPVSTTTGFGSTRPLTADSWESVRLGDGTTANPPDWIYIDRAGNTPTAFSANWTNSALANENFVIGRFAYRLYDVGGLLDLNLVGNASSTGGNTTNANRSSLRDLPLDLSTLPGMTGANLLDFASWRDNEGALDRPVLSRGDLLHTLQQRGEIPLAAARWFTHSSKTVDAPSYFPNPNLVAASPGNLTAALLNPALPAVRFNGTTTLLRGSDPDLTVRPGAPAMPRKFPLSKLNLLSDPSASPQDLTYYFGLQRQGDGSFRYTAIDASGVIKDLATVATEGREPNFFEVLQAVIATGSLGRNAGNTYTVDQERDGLRTRQTWQIGANIIDQWDSDDFPTTVSYFVPAIPPATGGAWQPVYGVENLPYINSVAIMGHRPEWDRNRFQLWAVFDVWNPHQNANTPPSGIDSFRIAPRSGSTRTTLNLSFNEGAATGFSGLSSPISNTTVTFPPSGSNPSFQAVLPLNTTRLLQFSGNGTYGTPTLVGQTGPPTSPDWSGGLLLHDFENVPDAVPANIHEKQSEYSNLITSNSTTNPGLNLILSRAGLPLIGNGTGGTFGAKAHNWFRMTSPAADRVIVDLQYRRDSNGSWVTFQTLEGFPSAQSSSVTDTNLTRTNLLDNTLFSVNSTNTNNSFYGWRFDQTTTPIPDNETRMGFTMMKYDPRTIRFGHNELRRTQRERTIRQSIAPLSDPVNDVARDLVSGWMMLRFGTSFIAGYGNYTSPTQGMERIEGVFGGTNPSGNFLIPFGYIANIPEAPLSLTINPSRYQDRDGVIRPGDGYLGSVPTALPLQAGTGRGSLADRPLLLNRPFRSVAEMGHAFRDLPWKSLDFFTRNSGDLGLLDAFTLDPVEGEMPVVEGKVNLNSAPEPVLALLLAGSARTASGGLPIPQAEATPLAKQIVDERRANGPFATVGDLVARVFSPTAHNVNGTFTPAEHRKSEREAAIRTLSAIGDTRTWNLLFDLVVQPGRFSPSATAPDQFQGRGERRYWIHLGIDRITGQVAHLQWEPIHE